MESLLPLFFYTPDPSIYGHSRPPYAESPFSYPSSPSLILTTSPSMLPSSLMDGNEATTWDPDLGRREAHLGTGVNDVGGCLSSIDETYPKPQQITDRSGDIVRKAFLGTGVVGGCLSSIDDTYPKPQEIIDESGIIVPLTAKRKQKRNPAVKTLAMKMTLTQKRNPVVGERMAQKRGPAGRTPAAVKGTPAKTFQCDVCFRRFRRRDNLNRHSRCLHTNNKPFKCETCGTTFSRSDNLSQHIWRHT